MKHLWTRLPALLAPLALSACGGGSGQPPSLNCPTVAVLQQASTLTAFEPGRQDAGAERTTAQITGVAGACELKNKTTLRVKFQPGFTATDGPANHGQPLTLPYFVSITNGDAIVAKTIYSIQLSFDGNIQTATATGKTITIDLPSQDEDAQTEILIGFQLTPGQLAYATGHPQP